MKIEIREKITRAKENPVKLAQQRYTIVKRKNLNLSRKRKRFKKSYLIIR